MGSGKGEKGQPALQPGYIAVASEEAAEAGQPYQPVEKWHGSLLQCCGSCDLVGVGSCLWAYYLPCCAFGSNARKAFRQNAWLHGLAFLMLFTVLSWLAGSFLMAANHNVLARCNGDLPGPKGDWLEPADERRLWSKTDAFKKSADWSMDWDWEEAEAEEEVDEHHHNHPHENDNDDDDHHHKDDDDSEALKKPCKHKGKGKPGKGKHDKEGKHGNKDAAVQAAGSDTQLPQPLSASSFQTVSDFVDRKTSSNLRGDMLLPKPEDDLLESPECQNAVLVYCGAWLSVFVSALLAVTYAARRRTMLRKKFGIAGSKLGDFCTWFWCGPCALCQETRTLWSNNVEDGVCHTSHYVAVPASVGAPQSQFMTS